MKKTLLTVLASCALLMTGCFGQSNSDLQVVKEKTFELGDTVSLNPEDYIESENADLSRIEVKGDWINDPQYDYSPFNYAIKNKGSDYLKTGTYSFILADGSQDYTVTVKVEDTQAPEFISPSSILPVRAGDTEFDLKEKFTVKDKDEFTITTQGDYDINTPGSYVVTVIATDKSGNKSEVKTTVKVIAPNQPVTEVDEDTEIEEPEVDQPEESQPVETPEVTQPQPEPSQPEQDQNSPVQTPEESKPEACPVSKAPAGSKIYYSFEECYQAGLEWNKQKPGNYFYYLQGTDDCGNPVYLLTTGSSDVSTQSDQPGNSEKAPGQIKKEDQN